MYLIYCNGHEPCCRTLPRPVAGPGSISRRGWCRAEMRERGMHRMISDVSSSSSFFHSILILYTGGFCSFSNSFQMIQWFNLIQLRKRIGTPPRLVFFLAEVASVPTNSVQRFDEPPSTSWTSLATESGPFKRQLMLQWFVSMLKVDETWAKRQST